MGIKVTSSFDEQAALPLDSRTIQINLAARDNIPSSVRYDGLEVYVIDEQTTYKLEGGITNADWFTIPKIDDTNSTAESTYSSQKIDSLISGSLNYLGAWDADTNTPSISDATGTDGDYYKVSVEGDQNLGQGLTTYYVGDDLIHNGTVYQQFSDASTITVEDNLTSTSAVDALSANQGRILNENKEPTLPDGTGNAGKILELDADETTKKWVNTTANAILWFPEIMYGINSLVSYDGFMWKALQSGSGKQPNVSAAYWEKVFVEEAPDDGTTYWRKDKSWTNNSDYGSF